MRKGIITTLVVTICMMLAATYAFAAPAKARKSAKTEPTTTEKKEVTTTEKEKTTTEATTESKKVAIEEETSKESATDQEEDDSEEVTDQEKNAPESDSKNEDNKEIDDEEIDRCNHEWTEPSYAFDPEKGYVITQDYKKCHLVKDTPISFEEYEEATKDQESREEDCEYEDNDNVEVVE